MRGMWHVMYIDGGLYGYLVRKGLTDNASPTCYRRSGVAVEAGVVRLVLDVYFYKTLNTRHL